MTINVGEGMRSADIPDGWGHLPDRGTCPVCKDEGIRLKKNDTLWQHWQYGWPRKRGYPPCAGTGQKPTALNAGRLRRHLAEQRATANDPDDITITFVQC